MKPALRAAAAFVAAIALVALMVLTASWAFRQLESVAEARRHTLTVIIQAEGLLSDVKDAETGSRGYLLTGSEAYLEPYIAAVEVIGRHQRELRVLARSPDARERVDRLAPMMDAKLLELAALVVLARKGDMLAAIARLNDGHGRALMDAIRDEARGLQRVEAELLAEQEATYRAHMRRMAAIMAAAALLALVSALALVVLIRRDLTRRLGARLLQQESLELACVSRMKSEFLATMSHELRTPLNAIIGFSEVLGDGLAGPTTEQQKDFLDRILDSGKHLLSLVNDILELANAEAGKMTVNLERVQLSKLLDDSVSLLDENAGAHRIRLHVDAAADAAWLVTDAAKVTQIVFNLLSNAVKFTPDGGRVTLASRRLRRAEVGRRSGVWPGESFPLANSTFAEFVEISITDTGIGIATEKLARLFTPFGQLDGGLQRRFEGTGLGLALVKLFAELLGGAVAVESAVGEGSRFTVWLPFGEIEGEPAEGVARLRASIA